jgi:hypothetical protein
VPLAAAVAAARPASCPTSCSLSICLPSSFHHESRRAAQEEALRENAARLEALVGLASALSTRQEAVLRETVEALRRRHVALTQRLLRVMRHVSAARSGTVCF